jgi:hypothetical protein
MTINESRQEFIKEFENKINNKIDKFYNSFYIQVYNKGQRTKYGVIFNGEQIALCDTLQGLEQVINALLFVLDGGIKK